MNRDQIIGLVLIGVILIGYSYFTRPSEEEIKHQRQLDSIAMVEQQQALQAQELANEEKESVKALSNDSVSKSHLNADFGYFASVASGEMEHVVLENDLLKLDIATLGGRIYSADLKEFHTYDSLPLILFDGDSTIFGFKFPTSDRRFVETNKMYFTSQGVQKDGEKSSLTMRLQVDSTRYIDYIYTLTDGEYMVDYKVRLHNMNDIIAGNTPFIDLEWQMYQPGQEKGKKFENTYSGIYYKYYKDEVDNLNERSASDDFRSSTKLRWVAYKQQFFSSVLIAGDYFSDTEMEQTTIEDNPKYLKHYHSIISVPYESRPDYTIDLGFYFGPNHYNTLKEYDLQLEKLVPMGWGIFGWVNQFAVIPIFNFLGSFISNYGIIILLMTIIIKGVLFPLTYRSYRSSAKMRVLKPQVEELTKNIPKDKSMEKQQKTMELYRKAGVNPMGGCLPMLLQMPILIAMFRFFPASIELRQESFLWADDLSSYDSILNLPWDVPFYGDHVSLFTLLMTISTIIYTRMNQNQMGDASTQMPGMKTMMYIFPVMMLFWFNSYASGLSYYYLVANVITFAQMYFIKRYIDEDAILKKLEANKKKPAKKSGFQSRLEKMAKERGYQPPKKK